MSSTNEPPLHDETLFNTLTVGYSWTNLFPLKLTHWILNNVSWFQIVLSLFLLLYFIIRKPQEERRDRYIFVDVLLSVLLDDKIEVF